MSQEEVYGSRDRTYSAWHRRKSTARYVTLDKAQLLAMIDVDCAPWVEYDDQDKHPVALIETAIDVGQSHKNNSVTKNLAAMAKIPGLLVLYTPSDKPNPADPGCPDIDRFRVRLIWPKLSDWTVVTPEKYCDFLLQLRMVGARAVEKLLGLGEP